MILEANERGSGAELARHLLNPRDNDHVTVHAIDGFISDNLFGAFDEAEVISSATQCQKYLFSLSLNPPPGPQVPVDVFEDTIVAVEQKLGLTGQPRAIVFHEKLGRRHAHVVWSRIDAGQMKAIKLSHYKRKLMDISRELYRTHEWDMPEGFKDHDARDPQNYSRQEAGQAKRAKVDPKAQKELFQRCWVGSDSRSAFAAALWQEGYILARGARRGFVAVDAHGKIWSLSRWCGVKPADLRARLGSEDQLCSVEQAISAFAELETRSNAKLSAKPNAEYDHRLATLVHRQRKERAALSDELEKRRLSDLKALQAQLPRGVKAMWMRVTGRYQSMMTELAKEAETTATRARTAEQVLIDRHLSERRALDPEFTQTDILADLMASFDTASCPDPRQHLVLPPDDIPFTTQQLLQQPDLILGHISHKKARFTRTDVLRELARRIPDPMALKSAADTAIASKDLIGLESGGESEFTTKEYRASEIVLDAAATGLSKSGGFAVGPSHTKRAIRDQNSDMHARFGGQLSDEQRDALNHILGDSQLSCVVGLAGSGKSTMLKTARDAWAKQGVIVHGAALSGKAAAGLQAASGIASRTLASLEASWKNGYEPVARGDVVVVDEAGMVGTRQMTRVTTKLQSIGAKLVLIGDPDQLQPVEAGTPFRHLINAHGATRLTEIHRQRVDWQRKASRDLAEGNIHAAVERYVKHGAVTQAWNHATALPSLVEDYVADVELTGPDTSRLAFTHRRKDVFALNQAIRGALRSSGAPEPEILYHTDTGPRAFAKADRIVFTRNDRNLGVKNGMLGTVTSARHNEITVVLDADGGKRQKVTFDPKHYPAFDHGYAVTIHKSQGATVDRSFVLASRTMDAPLTYVAMTRHRDDMSLYIDEQDQPKWARGQTVASKPTPHRRDQGPRR